MSKIKSVSESVQKNRVTPLLYQNNYFKEEKALTLCSRLYFLIKFQTFLGLNRVHLITRNFLYILLSNIYGIALVFLSAYLVFRPTSNGNAIYNILKYTNCAEFILLIFSTVFLDVKLLSSFFDKLLEVDKRLNIAEDAYVTMQVHRGVYWLLASVGYSVVECAAGLMFVDDSWDAIIIVLYLAMSAHDTEQIFLCILLKSIYIRLRIIKAHARKVSDITEHKEEVEKELSEVPECLAKKSYLSVNSINEVYDMLHNCSEILNSIMSFPMLVMLITSGLSTTLLTMGLIKMFQINELTFLIVVYTMVRCTKYTGLVVVACYYCNMTLEQVVAIRTVLHDAINLGNEERMKRRQLKAFLQMARDNEFTYSLCGVIGMDMSLPLNYISICTTYLVIIIQFSKFID